MVQIRSGTGGKVIPEFPLNDVTAISFKDADGEISLEKKDDVWTVGDRWAYPADFSKIRELIQDVWDLKVTRSITAGPSQYGRLGLVTPGKGANSGILLTFNGEGNKEIANLLLGKEHMRKSEAPSQFGGGAGGEFPDGRYVLPNGNGEAISLVSETFSSVDVDAKYWLSKDFIKVEKLQSANVTHPEASDSWSISRDSDTADMTLAELADGQEIDSTKSYSLKNILSSPSFNDLVDPSASAEDTGLDRPIVAQLKTFDGFTYDLKIGKADSEDNYPVQVAVSADIATEREKPEDEAEEDTERLDKEFAEKQKTLTDKLATEQAYTQWTYSVSKWTVDALLNKRADLIKKPEEEEAGSASGAAASPLDVGPPLPISGIPPVVPEPVESAIESAVESAVEAVEEVKENVEEAISEVTNPIPAPEQ